MDTTNETDSIEAAKIPTPKRPESAGIKVLRFTGAFIVLTVAVFFIYYSDSIAPQSEYEREKEAERIIFNNVSVSAKYNVIECKPEFPVQIEINNRSTATILSTSIDMTVRRDGFSRAVNSNPYAYSDKIIEPNQRYTFCTKLELQEAYAPLYERPELLLFDVSVSMLNTDGGYINRPLN